MVGLLLVASSASGCGALLVRTRARASGLALVVFGVVLVAAVVAWPTWPALAVGLVLFGWGVCFCGALLAYPSVEWRDPVSFVLWVTVLSAGGLVTFGGGTPATMTPGCLVLGVALVGSHLWRTEHLDERDRISSLWMMVAVVSAGMVFGHSVFLMGQTPARTVGLVAFAWVPIALVVGVRRPTVVDVRGLVVEAVVLEVSLISYVSLFIGATSVAELAGADEVPTGTLALLGAVSAAGYHPLRVGLRGVIDELLFGRRPDPLHAATRVADQIGDDPVLALGAVREAMVLPYAALVTGGEVLASSGEPVPHTRRLRLALGDDQLGEVVVGLRPGDLRLSPADERVLRIVAPLLAQTLRARSLADDLRTSRGHAITAIEEERRRLRRDLHDGLGPALSGIAFTADAARNSLEDPGAVDALLRTVRAEATAAVGEIRRLVYGMRPPALDELGLVGALRQSALQMRTADGRPLAVELRALDSLRELPAGVEVAAYRIAVEALTNAARHSGSDHAELTIGLDDDALTLVVRDRGTGGTEWHAGVGMASMTERATEIGGTVHASPTPDGGKVTARLPLP